MLINPNKWHLGRKLPGILTPRPAPSPARYFHRAFLALIAVYLAVFKDWRQYLSPGEVGTIKVIACDRRQARANVARGAKTQTLLFSHKYLKEQNINILLFNILFIVHFT
jgi:hypothetical protein